MFFRRFACAAALLAACLSVSIARAQGIATDKLIDPITVFGKREQTLDVPNPTASKTAAQLRLQNLVNPEDALRYVPNLTIRKRYIGDRNALIGGRSFSTLQSARGLVLVDGYLLSNFLGRFDAPRWNMIAAEEIERVDILYGPFSAIYPGNSIGTTIAVRTRRPEELELSVRTTAFGEQFDEYGREEDFGGYQVSAFLGDRLDSSLWFSLAANRQDATSHPMQYYTVSSNERGEFPSIDAPATPVTGVQFDTDPRGRRRAIFGANAGAIDHTVQDQMKLRSGYAFTDWLEAEGFVALWRNDSTNRNRTFLRDAVGNEVWSGRVVAEGVVFDIPTGCYSEEDFVVNPSCAVAFAPSTRQERHVQWGTSIRTTRPSGWNGSLVYSEYAIDKDVLLEAKSPDPVAANGGLGANTARDGTGWQTFEAQGVYTPAATDALGGIHTLSVGVHQNEYQLRNPVFDTADWRRPNGTLAQDVFGETRLRAAYIQDKWDFSKAWSLTLGLRYEDWDGFQGGQRIGATAIDYPSRSISASSPKASVAFTPNELWSLRLSAGRGVRFPTVSELFQGTATGSTIIVNDPSLHAEVGDSVDLTIERWLSRGSLRASIFQDDVRDSIFAQTNILVTPNVTNVQNVDRVRTRGIEASFAIDGVGFDSLSLEGSIAYADSKILENDNFPISIGNRWPRVPKWRGNVQAVWRPNDAWFASLGFRHSGRMYNRLENDDVNPDTYGGVSRFSIFDARVSRTLANGMEIAIGIDNLANERSYQSHPLQMRTGYLEARWSIRERDL
jgi:iron complex outermembrane receptor protein